MKYTVRIDDKEYVVEIKDLRARPIVAVVDGVEIEVNPANGKGGNGMAQPAPASAAPTSPAAAPAARVRPPAAVASGNIARAPIPGVILSILVKPGETVKKGQELFVIEAMKMKNTVRAGRDGVVAEVLVAPGTTVNHNAPIVSFVEG